MKNTFYIVRMTDTFGDSWPIASTIHGIDWIRHETLEAAKSVAATFANSREFRVEMRKKNGWTAGTIKGVSIAEVIER